MEEIHLESIDLNLLVVVDAVLRERSATRAAARLHVTQSAVSSALRRARALFRDPLVVRNGRGFALTPRAEALAPRLDKLLEETRSLVAGTATRDPAEDGRRFTIACTDGVAGLLLPAVLPRLRARLPRATLRAVTLDRVVTEGFERAAVDLVVGVPPMRAPEPMVRSRAAIAPFDRYAPR